MTSRFRWHASGCDERLYVLLATRRASWNGRQKPEATFLATFGTPSNSLMKLFTRLGEISVCSLWMHIRRLLMAIRRLCMAVHSLQTEISACSADDFIRHSGPFQHASWTFSSGSPNHAISFHNSGKAFALSYFPLTFAPLNGKRVLGNLFQNKTRL